MTWEAVSAMSSLVTGIVILLTVVYAARQVRVLSAQTEDLHRATQFDGMLRIFDRLQAPEFLASRLYILNELPKRLNDPQFLEELKASDAPQPWLPALTALESVGTFIHFGYLEGPPFYYNYGAIILGLWPTLTRLIELHRIARDNPYAWKDTEEMVNDLSRYAVKFVQENPRIQPSTGKVMTPEMVLGPPPGKA
ncbi:MAG: hypothetical protein NVS1B14_02260 [Vulcanimicrobiaceae bacterium]